MNNVSVFSFRDYRKFLSEVLSGEFRRMTASELARKTGYQRSLISRVLNGNLHFTTEGTFKIARALSMHEAESEFLFWLVEKERASEKDYRAHAVANIQRLARRHEQFKKAADTKLVDQSENFPIYLNHWIYVAAHLMTATEPITSKEIANKLSQNESLIHGVLLQLCEMDLIERKGASFTFKKGSLHIANDSSWVKMHHSNWRKKALDEVSFPKDDSVHFTNLMTMSKIDFEKIRDMLLETIHQSSAIARPSDPEQVVCLNLDFFKI